MVPTRRFRIYVGYTDGQLADNPTILPWATQILLDAGIDNFTRYREQGFWNQIGETAVIFEIISSDQNMPFRVRRAAATLKTMPEGKQEAVLVTTDLIESYLI